MELQPREQRSRGGQAPSGRQHPPAHALAVGPSGVVLLAQLDQDARGGAGQERLQVYRREAHRFEQGVEHGVELPARRRVAGALGAGGARRSRPLPVPSPSALLARPFP